MFDSIRVQACSYPGTVINGKMSAVKFYYSIGEEVTFTCYPDKIMEGSPTIRCLKNAKWSSSVPLCLSSYSLRRNNTNLGAAPAG
ncbi:hypothetical protein M8J76_003894 [Diaphorina citri]|nr:hypothetical protein M8J76_003894 [Diaphorina citri]